MSLLSNPVIVKNVTNEELIDALRFVKDNRKLPLSLFVEAVIAYQRIYQHQNYRTGESLYKEVLVSQDVTNVIIK